MEKNRIGILSAFKALFFTDDDEKDVLNSEEEAEIKRLESETKGLKELEAEIKNDTNKNGGSNLSSNLKVEVAKQQLNKKNNKNKNRKIEDDLTK